MARIPAPEPPATADVEVTLATMDALHDSCNVDVAAA